MKEKLQICIPVLYIIFFANHFVFAKNVDMNTITQQDIDAVFTTTHGIIINPNVIMNPNIKVNVPNNIYTQNGISTPEDNTIISQINKKIIEDGTLYSVSVSVTCQDGNVLLQGKASTLAQIDKVMKLVVSIPGVKSVTSRMTIK